MSWTVKGTMLESCSCAMACRCTMGPTTPDQKWCSSIMCFQIDQGQSEGVNLAGTKIALHMELPGDFVSGVIDKARVYVDSSASAEQQRELIAVFSGQRGGIWAAVDGMTKEWIEPAIVAVDIQTGEKPSATIGSVGKIALERMLTEDGQQAKLVNAPVAAAFGMGNMDLALANGSGVSDPELRSWETLGFGQVSSIEFSG